MKLKKFSALIFALLLMFSLCSCGKMTTEKLVAGTIKAISNVNSFSGTMDTELDISANIFGSSIEVITELDTDLEYSDNTVHASGVYNVRTGGLRGDSPFSTPIDSYTVTEGDTITNYSLSDGTWYKSSSEAASVDTGSLDLGTIKDFLDTVKSDSFTLSDELETFNGQDVYVLTIENCKYTDLALDLIISQIESSLGDIDLSTIDTSEVNMHITLKVYKETKLPAQITIDFGDSLSSLVDSTVNTMFGEVGSQFADFFDNLNIGISISTCTVSVCFDDYNNTTVTIPDEALNAQEATGDIYGNMAFDDSYPISDIF